MKKLTYLLLLLLIVPFMSCSNEYNDNDGINKDYPASLVEIQGTWTCYKNGTYYTVLFDDDFYEIDIRNVFADDPFSIEFGFFTMDEEIITLEPYEGTTIYSPLKAYWTDSSKRVLYLYPIGEFTSGTAPGNTNGGNQGGGDDQGGNQGGGDDQGGNQGGSQGGGGNQGGSQGGNDQGGSQGGSDQSGGSHGGSDQTTK